MKRGYSLFELVIYIGIVAAIAALGINGILSLVRTFGDIRSYNDLRSGASVTMERLLRETRNALSVDMTGTVLSANPGRLKLSSLDESGNPKTIEFAVVGSTTIDVIEQSVDKGSIMGNGLILSGFVVRYSTTTKSGIVKFEVSVQDTRTLRPRAVTFYGSAVLRGAY